MKGGRDAGGKQQLMLIVVYPILAFSGHVSYVSYIK